VLGEFPVSPSRGFDWRRLLAVAEKDRPLDGFFGCGGGGGRQEIAGAISLWSEESESLALASASRYSGTERCSVNSRFRRPAASIPAACWRWRKKTVHWTVFLDAVVEAAGIEPASASTLQTVLHT